VECLVGVYDGTGWTICVDTILLDALELHSDVALRNFIALSTFTRMSFCLETIVVSLHCIDTLALGRFTFLVHFPAFTVPLCPYKVNASNAARFLISDINIILNAASSQVRPEH